MQLLVIPEPVALVILILAAGLFKADANPGFLTAIAGFCITALSTSSGTVK